MKMDIHISGWSMLLGLTFLLACKKTDKPVAGAAPNPGTQIFPVETVIVSSSALAATLEVPGTIMANEVTDIHPEVAGRIIQLNIKEGQQVQDGFLLAKLYDGDLQARLRKVEVQLEIAEQTEKRYGELIKIQGISQQEYDLSYLEVKSLKADLEILKEDIRKTEIRAPFAGKLGLKNVSPGAYVTPSTVLTSINQLNQLKLQFNVPERYSGQIKTGQQVEFTVEGIAKTFTARVMATSSDIQEATRSLAVRAIVEHTNQSLTPGTFAKIRMVLSEDPDAMMVPNSVIIPQGRKKLLYLYKEGKAMPAEVVTGVRDSINIQVLQGVQKGDTVITSGILYMRPGLPVQLKSMNPAER